jgi:hypothetical protein
MADDEMSRMAQALERRAQELKQVARDHAGALRLRIELEQLHEQCCAGVGERVRNLNYLARAAVFAGQLGEAERAAHKCVELYRPVAAENDETLATYLMMLSCVLAGGGEFDEAVVYGEEAVAIFARNHGERDGFVVDRRRDIRSMRNYEVRRYLDE